MKPESAWYSLNNDSSMSTATVELTHDSLPATATTPSLGAEALSLLARLCVPAGEVDPVRVFAESQPDWAGLLGVAADHGLLALACKRLLELPRGVLSEEWRTCCRQEFVRQAHRNLRMTVELVRIVRALERCGVQATPFKGPVLAQQAYGDLALRQFNDLDIVLPHAHLFAAHRALEVLGYRAEGAAAALTESRIPGQYAYRTAGEPLGMLLELHTEKTMRYCPVPLNWKALAARFETVSIEGQALRTFSVEDTLVLTCVHGTKHFWTRLCWICDIAHLVQAPRGIDWRLAERLARSMRCRRMLLLGLALANELFAIPLPENILRQVREDARVQELSRKVRERYLHGGEVSVSGGERLRFRSNSQDTLITGLRQLSIFATRPTDEDWKSHALPRWASPLYAILRPLRIARAYGLGLRQER
jgi:hypothetical protein